MVSNCNSWGMRRWGISLLAVMATTLLALPVSHAEDASAAEPERTFDDLVRVEDAKVGMAYIDPDADFSVFKRVALLKPGVAFRSNWQRDQNRSRTNNISAQDMERIKSDVANLFDSLSGDIIGRAADRQAARSHGSTLSWSNSVTNTAEARRMFGRWADRLVAFLDSHYN
jgi:hypothetical protein